MSNPFQLARRDNESEDEGVVHLLRRPVTVGATVSPVSGESASGGHCYTSGKIDQNRLGRQRT